MNKKIRKYLKLKKKIDKGGLSIPEEDSLYNQLDKIYYEDMEENDRAYVDKLEA